jgi:hypothetical protein
MKRSFKLASEAGLLSLSHSAFAIQVAMVLIATAPFALTVGALEASLLGDESPSAVEAAMAISGSTKPGPKK